MLSALALIAASAPGTSAATPDEHARACKCGPRCRGGACCCAPRSAPKPTPPPRETPKADDEGRTPDAEADQLPDAAGPCLAEAPRGEDATPTKVGPAPTVHEAIAEVLDRAASLAEGRVPLPTSDRPPAGDADRLDRPPKPGRCA